MIVDRTINENKKNKRKQQTVFFSQNLQCYFHRQIMSIYNIRMFLFLYRFMINENLLSEKKKDKGLNARPNEKKMAGPRVDDGNG